MILDELFQSFPFLKLGFMHASLFCACVFFVALSFGLLLGMAFPKKSASSRSARFVFACVFLTLATVFYTLLIFLCGSLFPLDSFLASHASSGFSKNSYYLILLGIFLCGLLISLFWKVTLPIFVVLGALFTFFNYSILYSEFGTQSDIIRFTVEEEKIIVEGHEIKKSGEENYLEFSALSLPDTIPLPLRRNYFRIKNIPTQHSSENQNSFLSKILHNPATDFYKNKILLKNRSDFQVTLPDSAIYPSLYSAQITFKEGKPTCTFKREL